MPQELGTVYVTQMPSLSDPANIQDAFRYYHFGDLEEGSPGNYGGITGHLYSLNSDISTTNSNISTSNSRMTTIQSNITSINSTITTLAPKTTTTALDDKIVKNTPSGAVMVWAGATVPTGWLLCDGASKVRADFSSLFDAIGTTYGSASDTHFNLPNLLGRVPVGFDSSQTEFNELNKPGGDKSVILTTANLPVHNHAASSSSSGLHSHTASTDTSGNHTHSGSTEKDSHRHSISDTGTGSVYAITAVSGGTGENVANNASSTDYTSYDEHSHTFSISSSGAHSHTVGISDSGSHTHTIVIDNAGGSAGVTQAHNNLQPYIVMNYIIKA
jgi:microcystin-dependent protein